MSRPCPTSSPRILRRACLALLVAATAGAATAGGGPVAPKAELPPSIDAGAPSAIALEMLAVPSADEVGVPAAPEGRVIKARRFPLRTGGELGQVELIHPKPPGEVVAWYGEHLEGWRKKEVAGVTYFWQGEEDFDPQGNDPYARLPNVAVSAPTPAAAMWPAARSEVLINYRAAGGS